MLEELVEYTHIQDIVGDVCRVKAAGIGLGDLAVVENTDGETSTAKVIAIDRGVASLQVFTGSKGLSTDARVRFLPHGLRATYSNNILGRIFRGSGEPIDGGPDLSARPGHRSRRPDRQPDEAGHAGEDDRNRSAHDRPVQLSGRKPEDSHFLRRRRAVQRAPGPHRFSGCAPDVVVFGGMGLIYDDFHFFRTALQEHGVFHRTAMYVNLASDPIVERLNVPDLALAVAEKFAVEQSKRVPGAADGHDRLRRRDEGDRRRAGTLSPPPAATWATSTRSSPRLPSGYEKACSFQGAGSVTILSVTTMPGGDLTHPVPDNTGYITEGQFYLHDGVIDPFGSLSRLKQKVVGKATREDHPQVMNTMIRLYAGSIEAQKKQAMAFELTDYDRKLLKFGGFFKKRFMDINASMPLLAAARTRCWKTMAECFEPYRNC